MPPASQLSKLFRTQTRTLWPGATAYVPLIIAYDTSIALELYFAATVHHDLGVLESAVAFSPA